MNNIHNRFLGSPSPASFHPEPVGASAPVGGYVAPRPVALPVLALTVRPDRLRPDRAAQDVVALRPELLRAIPHLKAGAPVELVPPPRRGGTWYLDTRPTAIRRVGKDRERTAARFNIPSLSREHYLLPAGAARGTFATAAGTAGLRPFLRFALGPEQPGHPGYYELLPMR